VSDGNVSESKIRLDKWLWFARFAKSRAQAQELIARGQVHRNGTRVEKPAMEVQPGDVVALVLGPVRRTVTVVAIGERRGPATEAQTLYSEPDPPFRLSPEEAVLPLHRRHGR
jgi:ribosome-associated heat shock protein Hsp15